LLIASSSGAASTRSRARRWSPGGARTTDGGCGALGFPRPTPDQLAFSDEDIEIMELLLPGGAGAPDELVQEARAISAALRRVADVLVDEIWRHYRAADDDAHAAQALAGRVDMARTERLLSHLLRRQLVASLYRRSALATSGSALAVGFVDLVGFTALAQQLDTRELGVLTERFEATTYDIVADAGGHFVKALGDGVLFTCPEAGVAATAALDMLDAVATTVAPARAAIGFGAVIVREGDVFGPVVNMASRLVELAEPGQALAPADLGLPGDDAGEPHVRDIGDLRVVALRRA
jgi:adenylate cyclase